MSATVLPVRKRSTVKVPRYRPFDYATFGGWMAAIGFTEVPARSDTWEFVWERKVNARISAGRYVVRIYSSVSRIDKVSRDVGGDAIRVLLIDTKSERGERVLLSHRVYRTESAKQNTIARAREAYGWVLSADHHCSCGNLMVERTGSKGPFLGCTGYPECKRTKPICEAA